MTLLHIKPLAGAVVASSFVAVPAFAEMMIYADDITAAAEVTPTESSKTGTAEVMADIDAQTVS